MIKVSGHEGIYRGRHRASLLITFPEGSSDLTLTHGHGAFVYNYVISSGTGHGERGTVQLTFVHAGNLPYTAIFPG